MFMLQVTIQFDFLIHITNNNVSITPIPNRNRKEKQETKTTFHGTHESPSSSPSKVFQPDQRTRLLRTGRYKGCVEARSLLI